MAEIKCVIVTPEETALDQPCAFVSIPLFDGEKGVGLNHAPMIGRLGAGELRLRSADGKVERFFVDGGFVQIANNSVSIMTNQAIPAGGLDAAVIREQLTVAIAQKANSDELFQRRDKAVTQARAQLRIANK